MVSDQALENALTVKNGCHPNRFNSEKKAYFVGSQCVMNKACCVAITEKFGFLRI